MCCGRVVIFVVIDHIPRLLQLYFVLALFHDVYWPCCPCYVLCGDCYDCYCYATYML